MSLIPNETAGIDVNSEKYLENIFTFGDFPTLSRRVSDIEKPHDKLPFLQPQDRRHRFYDVEKPMTNPPTFGSGLGSAPAADETAEERGTR